MPPGALNATRHGRPQEVERSDHTDVDDAPIANVYPNRRRGVTGAAHSPYHLVRRASTCHGREDRASSLFSSRAGRVRSPQCPVVPNSHTGQILQSLPFVRAVNAAQSAARDRAPDATRLRSKGG